MEILIPSIVDIENSAPNRLHHIIKYLSQRHNVTVLCPNDQWKKKFSKKSDFPELLNQTTIKFHSKLNINPVAQEVFCGFFGNFPPKKYDVIFNYNTLVSGYVISKRLGLPMVYDIADDLPSMIETSPLLPKALRKTGAFTGNFFMQRTVKRSAYVTCTCNSLGQKYGINQNKFCEVINGVDTEHFKPKLTGLREQLGLSGSFVLGYVGVLREWVDFKPIFQALRSFPNVKFLIIGDEDGCSKHKLEAEEAGVIGKVIFLGHVPYKDVPRYICAMDACTIPFKKNAVAQNAIPLKLFEYMACAKPVISYPLDGTKSIKGGHILFAEGCEQIKKLISELISGETVAIEMGVDNRKYVKDNLSWDTVLANLEDTLLKAARAGNAK